VRDGHHHLRELPDGGLEFVLDDPVLSCLVVDDRVTLRFGQTDVVVAEPFELEVDGVGHLLDPRRHDTLGPLLATYPGTARWLWASPDGRLTLVFMQGQRLVAPGPTVRSAWSISGSRGSDLDAAVDDGPGTTVS
jgi:Family of unknown function (DUF6188)